MRRFLSGTRILDISRATAGPFGTQILADLGAEVIKIETPSGGPNPREYFGDPELRIAGVDAMFLAVNRNKKSILLDLRKQEGLDLFYQLVKKANVVYDNYRPGVMEAMKLGYDTLKELNPGIICCSVSGYGATGPWSQRAGQDLTLLAETGMMAFIDRRDSAGLLDDPKVNVGDLLGGMYAAQAVTAALFYQARTGEGFRIDIAMYDSVLSWLHGFGLFSLNLGVEYDPRPTMLWGIFRTKDEPLALCAHRNGPFKRLCQALGRGEWLSAEQFATSEQRISKHKLLRSLVQEELRRKTKAEWLPILEQAAVPYAEICTMTQGLTSAQAQARKMNVIVEHPEHGNVTLIGNPMKFAGLEDQFTLPPSPGEHTADTFGDILGLTIEQLADLKARGIVQ